MMALERGIDLITFTCHIPQVGGLWAGEGIRMRRDQVDDYRRLIADTARRAKDFGVEVLCGIEAEVFPNEVHDADGFDTRRI